MKQTVAILAVSVAAANSPPGGFAVGRPPGGSPDAPPSGKVPGAPPSGGFAGGPGPGGRGGHPAKPLSLEQVSLIRTWIDQGAK